MAGEVEFRDEVGKLFALDIKMRMIDGKSLEVVDQPFACDVIRHDDLLGTDAFQHGCDNVICINIPASQSGSCGTAEIQSYVPFTELQVTDAILLHERVSCAYTGNDTCGNIVLGGFAGGLVDSMERRSTTDSLKNR